MTDQAQLCEAFNTIRLVALSPGKKDKEKILKQGKSEYLQIILNLTYDKFKTYRILQIEQPASYLPVQPDTLEEFVLLTSKLAAHTMGSNEARLQVKAFLAKNSKEGAEVFTNVLLRDLRGGFSVTTINKVFPGLVPTFKIQLGYALDSWDRISYPIAVDEKIDGIRCPAIYNGDTVRFYSREGFEFETGMDAFAEQIKMLVPGMKFMLDCEFRAFKFNPNDKVCQKHKDGNWKFEYAKAISRRKVIDPEEIREFFKLYIWDVVDLQFFESLGVKGEKLALEQRKLRLASMFLRHGTTYKNLEVVASFIATSKEDIMAYMRETKLQGLEGCMLKPLNLPYSFGKNFTIIKLKHFCEGDVRILDAQLGEKGKKYEDILGILTIGTDDGKIKCNLGSGFTDLERVDLWMQHLRGELVGKIIEVQYKDISIDGAFQLPTLLRFREDRDDTNSYEELMSKLVSVVEED